MTHQTLTRPVAPAETATAARPGWASLPLAVRVAVPVVAIGALVAVPAWVAATRTSGTTAAPVRVAADSGLQAYRAGERGDLAPRAAAKELQDYRAGERAGAAQPPTASEWRTYRAGERTAVTDAWQAYRAGERND